MQQSQWLFIAVCRGIEYQAVGEMQKWRRLTHCDIWCGFSEWRRCDCCWRRNVDSGMYWQLSEQCPVGTL